MKQGPENKIFQLPGVQENRETVESFERNITEWIREYEHLLSEKESIINNQTISPERRHEATSSIDKKARAITVNFQQALEFIARFDQRRYTVCVQELRARNIPLQSQFMDELVEKNEQLKAANDNRPGFFEAEFLPSVERYAELYSDFTNILQGAVYSEQGRNPDEQQRFYSLQTEMKNLEAFFKKRLLQMKKDDVVGYQQCILELERRGLQFVIE